MPIIKPEIQKVLRAAGLEKERPEGESTISEKLDAAGLDSDSIAEELTHLAKHSGNDTLRLRALETALKVKGALREQATTSLPSFTIVIQPASAESNTPSFNPILFPRVTTSPNSNDVVKEPS